MKIKQTAAKERKPYVAIIGEVGNEIGHVVGSYYTQDGAIRAGKRAVKVYGSDGWYRVRQG